MREGGSGKEGSAIFEDEKGIESCELRSLATNCRSNHRKALVFADRLFNRRFGEVMKRFWSLNGVACAAAIVWAALTIIDIRTPTFRPMLGQAYRVSVLVLLVGLPILNAIAFRKEDKQVVRAVTAGTFLGMIFAYLGLVGIILLRVAWEEENRLECKAWV